MNQDELHYLTVLNLFLDENYGAAVLWSTEWLNTYEKNFYTEICGLQTASVLSFYRQCETLDNPSVELSQNLYFGSLHIRDSRKQLPVSSIIVVDRAFRSLDRKVEEGILDPQLIGFDWKSKLQRVLRGEQK